MKTFKYLSVACLSLGILASCSKDANQGPAPSNGEKHVVISMGGVQTKASDPVGLLSTTADVDNIAIFVTNTAGTILKKVEVDKNLTADSDWDKLTTAGLLIPNVGTEATDALSSFDVSVENANDENVYTFTGNVSIKPVMARLQIKQVSFVANGSETVTNNSNGKSALVEWTGLTGELLGVYLNNFYKQYNGAAVAASLMTNTTAFERATEGKWLFGADASETNEAAFASYNQWNTSAYTPYDLDEFNTPADPDAKKCFAFNFFPGQTPYLHLNLGNVSATTITSDDEEAYNPRLLPLSKYANIVNFTTGGQNVTFEAGKIYNVNVEIKPQFMHTDLNPVAYNITLTITIADWVEENIDPEFQQL